MRKLLPFLLSLFAIPVFAQSTPPSTQGTFSLTATAAALPGGKQTVAGTLMGQTYSVTNSLSARATEIIAPGATTTNTNFQAYLGGVQWFPNLSALLAKTKFSSTEFQPYITCSAGEDVTATGNHVAMTCGGGVNYDPGNTGHFSVNLVEIQYAKFPGYANSTAIVASGLKLTF